MTATFDSRGPEVSVDQIDAFEQTLPRSLPADYRQFLLEQNGGRTLSWWPPERGGPDVGDIDDLYSLGDVESWRSLTEVRQTFSDTLPGVFLAIGDDEGGAQICLSLQDEDYGAVWFYDPDMEFDPSEPTHPDLMRPLCASFREFLETLEPSPPPAEALRRLRAARIG